MRARAGTSVRPSRAALQLPVSAAAHMARGSAPMTAIGMSLRTLRSARLVAWAMSDHMLRAALKEVASEAKAGTEDSDTCFQKLMVVLDKVETLRKSHCAEVPASSTASADAELMSQLKEAVGTPASAAETEARMSAYAAEMRRFGEALAVSLRARAAGHRASVAFAGPRDLVRACPM